MKKLIATLCAALACSFLFTATPVQAKSADYERTQTKDYQIIWSNGVNKIYLKNTTKNDRYGNIVTTKQKLCLKNIKSKKVKVLKTLTVNTDYDECYSIANVYGTTIYLNRIRGVGDGDLYTYNWKTDKFTRVRKNFIVLNASGKYMITGNYMPSDIGPYPAYVYKITSRGLEKLKKLGANTTQAQFVNGRIYYAKFPNDGSIHSMSVWSCSASGKNAKMIFRVNAKDELGYVMLESVDKNSIVYVDVPNDGDPEYYRFDRKTEKTTQISEREVQKMLGE